MRPTAVPTEEKASAFPKQRTATPARWCPSLRKASDRKKKFPREEFRMTKHLPGLYKRRNQRKSSHRSTWNESLQLLRERSSGQATSPGLRLSILLLFVLSRNRRLSPSSSEVPVNV